MEKGEWKKTLLRSPVLEILVMTVAVVMSYFGLLVLSQVPMENAPGEMTNATVSLIVFAFFLLSVAIALVSVVAGIGGGVIFTPIMLAFTSVNSVIVRGTGLIVAMFSGLISTGVFIKKGIGNYKMSMLMTLSQGVGALVGAVLAIGVAESMGASGEGVIRLLLGLILVGLGIYFLVGGKKNAYPLIKHVDPVSKFLNMEASYFEESENKVRSYRVTRSILGIGLVFLVGFIGGFFGMGGGWAITPSLNLGMGIPLKVAAANSGVILGLGSCVSVWPYIFAGGLIPLFVLPWLSGQVVGGFVGSYVLAKIKVSSIRTILIGIMFYTSFGLVTKALSMLKVMENPPAIAQIIVLLLILFGIGFFLVRDSKIAKRIEEEKAKEAENKDIKEEVKGDE